MRDMPCNAAPAKIVILTFTYQTVNLPALRKQIIPKEEA
jgi:hypothetical protein